MLADSGDDELTVYGYCFGGVLSLLFVAGHPEMPVRNLGGDGDADRLQPHGHAVGDCSATAASTRRPRRRDRQRACAARCWTASKSMKVTGDLGGYASLLQNLESSEYVAAHHALTGWANDHIPFPGACFRQTVEWFMTRRPAGQGRRATGRSRRSTSARSTAPVLSVVGDADHIVPPPATIPLETLLPHTDVLRFPSGHVGLIVGRSAQRRTIPAIADWIESHSEST